MEIAYVEWLDARGLSGRMSRKDAEELEPLFVFSAGILVREDSETVTIAQDYWRYVDTDGTMPETVREVEVIPRMLVRKLEIVEISDKPPEEGCGCQQS